MENIDIPVAEKLGIQLINSPEGNRDSVAEHVVGMLVIMNRLLIASQEVKNGYGNAKKTEATNCWVKQ
jgi:D-3-phosphoglycerate dehydrogenase